MAQEFGSQNEFATARNLYTSQPQSKGFGTGIRYRGPWDPTGTLDPLGANYYVNDVVQFQGKNYLCLADTSAIPGASFNASAPNNTQYWRQVPSDSVMVQVAADDFGSTAASAIADDFAAPQVLEMVPQTPPGYGPGYTANF
jgi:hypothetical protein